MRAATTRQVFQHRDWIIVIDERNTFTGIRMNSTGNSTHSQTFTQIEGLDLWKIGAALSFKDNFRGNKTTYFWAIQGQIKSTMEEILLIFEVKDDDTAPLEYLVTLE